MIQAQQLAYFVAVYQHGSFHAAAASAGVSQSVVTKHIKRLEEHLHVKLFNRTTRKVEPTDIARQLVVKAEASLQSLQAFEAEARLLGSGELGSLRVGAIALASETLVTPALAYLSQSHPRIEVEVVVGSEDVYRDLATGRCDVVIGDEANFASSPYADALRMNPLRREQLQIVFRKHHPGKMADTRTLLKAYPWAIPSRYFNENELFKSLKMDLIHAQHYRLTSLTACLRLAEASDVITLAPSSLIDRTHNHFQVTTSSADIGLQIRFALFTLATNSPTPAIRALQTALRHA